MLIPVITTDCFTGSKKTVFERLGDSSVSSTTGLVGGSEQMRITITGMPCVGSSNVERPVAQTVTMSADKVASNHEVLY